MKPRESAGGQHGRPDVRKLMFSISTMEELGEALSSRDHFARTCRPRC
jgi:hypothetical protein